MRAPPETRASAPVASSRLTRQSGRDSNRELMRSKARPALGHFVQSVSPTNERWFARQSSLLFLRRRNNHRQGEGPNAIFQWRSQRVNFAIHCHARETRAGVNRDLSRAQGQKIFIVTKRSQKRAQGQPQQARSARACRYVEAQPARI